LKEIISSYRTNKARQSRAKQHRDRDSSQAKKISRTQSQ